MKKKKSKFRFDTQTVGTNDFYRSKVVYTKELMPGEDISIEMNTFTRLETLAKPTFMRADIVNRAFFVPYRTIFDRWNEFITDVPYQFGNGSRYANIPTVGNESLVSLFLEVSNNNAQVYTGTGRGDFIYRVNNTNTKYRFTERGKKLYSLLLGLGYQINWTSQDATTMSALPLLAYAKIWYDWFRNPNFSNGEFSKIFRQNGIGDEYSDTGLMEFLPDILDIDYSKDYFSSAWLKPVGPADSLESTFNLQDPTMPSVPATIKGKVGNGNVGSYSTDGTPAASNINSTGTLNNLTDYIVDALHRVTQYVKRHNIVGSKVLDRYFADYGFKLDSDKLTMSMHLGTHTVPITIGDVMSNSDTVGTDGSGASLGDYAGKGIGSSSMQRQGSNVIKFSTEEFGLLIITSTIIPTMMYTQGRAAHTKRLGHLDFFNSSFDNLGPEAISRDLLIANYGAYDGTVSLDPTLYSNNVANGIFGYLPRYSTYKAQTHDIVMGDYACGTLNEGAQSWFCYRPISGNLTQRADKDFNNAKYAAEDLSQIWMTPAAPDGSMQEHFNMFFDFNVQSYMPAKPLFDIFELNDEEDHKIEKVNIGGTQLR